MPGTIQVSVLDLMDLPPSGGNADLQSLKVVMGKRECQAMGKGDFSFPVVSLRENLIVMLLDKEGNVVSRTEFKIMAVVEKGIWDDLFPLEGGGHVHMKLQFLLSEEERQRIREVRESALKRKHMELLNHGLKSSSISGQKFEGSVPFPITEIVSTEALINQSEQTQASSKESDTRPAKSLETMPKSFSAGMLSEINFQQNPKFFGSLAVKKQEDTVHSDRGQNLKNLESGRQKSIKIEDFEGSSWDPLHIAHSSSPNGTKTVLRTTETEEHINEIENPVHIETKQGPPLVSIHCDSKAFEDKIDAQAARGAKDAMPSSHDSKDTKEDGAVGEANRSADRADEEVGISEKIIANHLQLYHEVGSELVSGGESKIEEQTLRELAYQHGSASNALTEDDDRRCCRRHSEEQTVELSIYSDYERCPFGSLGIWMPRHLCATTGSKQLRNLAGCCNIRAGSR